MEAGGGDGMPPPLPFRDDRRRAGTYNYVRPIAPADGRVRAAGGVAGGASHRPNTSPMTHRRPPRRSRHPLMTTYRHRQVDIIIDVRSRFEFLFGHLRSAVCIPAHRLERSLARRKEITHDSVILLYCASGIRSAVAARTLRKLGYHRVIDGGAMRRLKLETGPTGTLNIP